MILTFTTLYIGSGGGSPFAKKYTIKVLMSDGVVLHYVVTEIHPNVSCPDERADPMPNPPLALQYAEPGCPGAEWSRATDHERLTLQTSQGFNRNWGELIIVAQPRF